MTEVYTKFVKIFIKVHSGQRMSDKPFETSLH